MVLEKIECEGVVGYRQDGISPAGLPGAYAFQKVGARYYDPAFGCFLTRDTYLSQKPYAYCNGDPVNFSDPSGHKPPHKPGQPSSGTPPPSGPGPTSGGGSGGGGSAGGNGGVNPGGEAGKPSGGSNDAEANKGALHVLVDGVAGGAVGLVTTVAFAPFMSPIGSGMMGVAAGSDAAALADYYLTKAGY